MVNSVFYYFNSQPHEEADDNLITLITAGFTFQLTASRRGWLERFEFRCSYLHFNSQPHEEADERNRCTQRRNEISTHSLTKRLTTALLVGNDRIIFQLTASRRGWHFYFWCSDRAGKFQLTASRRGWPYRPRNLKKLSPFQLTASRRGWQYRHSAAYSHHHFNSQPHEEADKELNCIFSICSISTHSLTKRLTIPCGFSLQFQSIFQLTASRRGWQLFLCESVRIIFISTHSLTKRLTYKRITCGTGENLFQLTASRRGWQKQNSRGQYSSLFQLTASRRGWLSCRLH